MIEPPGMPPVQPPPSRPRDTLHGNDGDKLAICAVHCAVEERPPWSVTVTCTAYTPLSPYTWAVNGYRKGGFDEPSPNDHWYVSESPSGSVEALASNVVSSP